MDLPVILISLALVVVLQGTLVESRFTSNQDCSRPVCPDGVVEITCVHNNTASRLSAWRGTQQGGAVCNGIVSHDPPADANCIDGTVFFFSIFNVSNFASSPNSFSSVANITDLVRFNGLEVQCFDTVAATNEIGSCIISLVSGPPAAPMIISINKVDIVETTGSPPSPRTREFTLRWEAPASEADIVQYTVISNLLPAMNTANTELPVELGMSDTFTVVATDECDQSTPSIDVLGVNDVTISVNVPDATARIDGEVRFKQPNFTLSLLWPSVGPTAPIAVRGDGTVLVDGGIIGYNVRLSTGQFMQVNCSTDICSSGEIRGQLPDGTDEVTASVTAFNCLEEGQSRQITFSTGLSSGAIAGIVIACIVFALGLVVGVILGVVLTYHYIQKKK